MTETQRAYEDRLANTATEVYKLRDQLKQKDAIIARYAAAVRLKSELLEAAETAMMEYAQEQENQVQELKGDIEHWKEKYDLLYKQHAKQYNQLDAALTYLSEEGITIDENCEVVKL